jgi:hypothetical protein
VQGSNVEPNHAKVGRAGLLRIDCAGEPNVFFTSRHLKARPIERSAPIVVYGRANQREASTKAVLEVMARGQRRFVHDSPLEGARFEPSVPREGIYVYEGLLFVSADRQRSTAE